jgi:ATP-binding cassette subfamily B protein
VTAIQQSRGGLRPLRDLIPFVSPYWRILAAALAALAVAATATLILPLAVRSMIDLGFARENAAHINQYFLKLFAVACLLALATAARYYFVARLGERVVADIRAQVYAHVIGMSPGFFETTRTGEVLSRLTTDTTLIQSVIGASASLALRNLFLLLGGFTMLTVTSPRLTGFIIVGVPVVVRAIASTLNLFI